MITLISVAQVIVLVAFCIAFIRLLLGPSLPDRVVALDLMSTIATGGIGLYAIQQDRYLFTDAALVLAVILFLGTIAFAYYLEKLGAESS
ncbi:MAG TPA: monovalent cation/H+ antiporter complex subunit F [Planctomycetaceae bacterium]|nr:monovalent cation/H+ antiporter complex subunit F [Planctomycetaceae bacterium]